MWWRKSFISCRSETNLPSLDCGAGLPVIPSHICQDSWIWNVFTANFSFLHLHFNFLLQLSLVGIAEMLGGPACIGIKTDCYSVQGHIRFDKRFWRVEAGWLVEVGWLWLHGWFGLGWVERFKFVGGWFVVGTPWVVGAPISQGPNLYNTVGEPD